MRDCDGGGYNFNLQTVNADFTSLIHRHGQDFLRKQYKLLLKLIYITKIQYIVYIKEALGMS